jgi:hypothetical protein
MCSLKSTERKRAGTDKVEQIYNGKEERSFEEDRIQQAKGGLLTAVSKQMGRDVNRENYCEEKDELIVGEMGKRMVAVDDGSTGTGEAKKCNCEGILDYCVGS